MNIVRNPERKRSPELHRSPVTTVEWIDTRRDEAATSRSPTCSSPSEESTRAGSRIESMTPPAYTSAPNRKDHSAPTVASSPAIGPMMTAPEIAAIESRELTLTSVSSGGSSRGTAEARVTPYALDAIRQVRAAGKSQGESFATAPAITHKPAARTANVTPMAHRRPRRNRSRNGPMSGATTAKGSMVTPRNRATWPRAWSVGAVKNRVPANETVRAVSPPELNALSSSRRASPDSPAPDECEARRAMRRAPLAARPPAAATRLPVSVAFRARVAPVGPRLPAR